MALWSVIGGGGGRSPGGDGGGAELGGAWRGLGVFWGGVSDGGGLSVGVGGEEVKLGVMGGGPVSAEGSHWCQRSSGDGGGGSQH